MVSSHSRLLRMLEKRKGWGEGGEGRGRRCKCDCETLEKKKERKKTPHAEAGFEFQLPDLKVSEVQLYRTCC